MTEIYDFSSNVPWEKEEHEDFAVYAAMPDPQKRQLCIDLLEEFGVHDFNETKKGELQHCCSLPLGGHTDRDSVTASINYKKLAFKCWVCGARGGFLWWIAINRGEGVTAARKWLRDASGLTDGLDLPKLLDILDALFHPRSEKRVIPSYSIKSLDQWLNWPIHHPYLTDPVRFVSGKNEGGREVPEQTLAEFKIGYCDYDTNWNYYQRIIIPIFWKGDLVGWQARKLLPDDSPLDNQPMKYKNSPDLPRDRVLYGSETALSGREALVVESPLSVLRHAHHLPVIGTLGASVSDLQLPFLHRFNRVTLWLDNDPAGWNALQGTGVGKRHQPGLIEKLRDYVEVRVVQSPWWKADPADLTEAQAEDLYKSAPPAVLWKRPDGRKLQWYERG